MTDERVPVVDQRQRGDQEPRRVVGDEVREAGLGEGGLRFLIGQGEVAGYVHGPLSVERATNAAWVIERMIEQWATCSRSATTGSPSNTPSAGWTRRSRCWSTSLRCFPANRIEAVATTPVAFRCTRSWRAD